MLALSHSGGLSIGNSSRAYILYDQKKYHKIRQQLQINSIINNIHQYRNNQYHHRIRNASHKITLQIL